MRTFYIRVLFKVLCSQTQRLQGITAKETGPGEHRSADEEEGEKWVTALDRRKQRGLV